MRFQLLFFFLFLFLSAAHADDDGDTNPSHLVDEVCRQTSNYKFCVDSLYTDPRTPDADSYTLAFISFGLAYSNATNTQNNITKLLNNTATITAHDRESLHICQRDYKKALKALISAFNDLNSETFFTLPGLANVTANAAADCQAHYPPLSSDARHLQAISQICIVVAKLFFSE